MEQSAHTNKIIVAIDGYSSSGKSTMARALAARIGYVYVDSGAMYRAVTLFPKSEYLLKLPEKTGFSTRSSTGRMWRMRYAIWR